MTSRDFCYWLQGFFEIQNPESITKEQIDMIQRHLSMVFYHEIDPSYGDAAQQQALQHLHNPPVKPTPPPSRMISESGVERLVKC